MRAAVRRHLGGRSACRFARPSGAVARLVAPVPEMSSLGCRAFCADSRTQLGAYLERCGATWGDAVEIHAVQAADNGRTHSWRVELPRDFLESLRQGESVESPLFDLGGDTQSRGRFEFFPKGDAEKHDEAECSLWLWTDAKELPPLRLRIGSVEREGGSSTFCRLEDVLRDGVLDISATFEAPNAEEKAASPATNSAPVALLDADGVLLSQSLQLTGLQLAEWRLFSMDQLAGLGKAEGEELGRTAGTIVSSPPFRFHHVLLGDMYLELQLDTPHPEWCTVFFRCRVPTMQLQVDVSVGTAFSKSFLSEGRSTPEDDLKSGACLQVNLDAPGVLQEDGTLTVQCALEKVVSIPFALREMIPKLDERASWPKRL